nr:MULTISPECIES: hypothetical protein [unclassified Streptomyces]
MASNCRWYCPTSDGFDHLHVVPLAEADDLRVLGEHDPGAADHRAQCALGQDDVDLTGTLQESLALHACLDAAYHRVGRTLLHDLGRPHQGARVLLFLEQAVYDVVLEAADANGLALQTEVARHAGGQHVPERGQRVALE